jgi:hypothetical protein
LPVVVLGVSVWDTMNGWKFLNLMAAAEDWSGRQEAVVIFFFCRRRWRLLQTEVRMTTGRVWIGWSLRASKTETRSRNPIPNRTPIRMEIHHQNQTRGYPKPNGYQKSEWIPETRG